MLGSNFDEARAKTCCVTGHRDIPAEQVEFVKQELMKEAEKAISEGYVYFLTDLADGVDQYFAEVVAKLRENNDSLRLTALLPYRNRFKKLLGDTYTEQLLSACSEVGVVNEKFAPNSMFICRRRMLEQSSRMIAVFDGREKSGVLSAIRMAHAQGIKIQEIPLGLN